jgi:hypothetical protein
MVTFQSRIAKQAYQQNNLMQIPGHNLMTVPGTELHQGPRGGQKKFIPISSVNEPKRHGKAVRLSLFLTLWIPPGKAVARFVPSKKPCDSDPGD